MSQPDRILEPFQHWQNETSLRKLQRFEWVMLGCLGVWTTGLMVAIGWKLIDGLF